MYVLGNFEFLNENDVHSGGAQNNAGIDQIINNQKSTGAV
jgi:hypothetical protein